MWKRKEKWEEIKEEALKKTEEIEKEKEPFSDESMLEKNNAVFRQETGTLRKLLNPKAWFMGAWKRKKER